MNLYRNLYSWILLFEHTGTVHCMQRNRPVEECVHHKVRLPCVEHVVLALVGSLSLSCPTKFIQRAGSREMVRTSSFRILFKLDFPCLEEGYRMYGQQLLVIKLDSSRKVLYGRGGLGEKEERTVPCEIRAVCPRTHIEGFGRGTMYSSTSATTGVSVIMWRG